ncbi:branched-chain amino acid aminotransferase/4-amino-4-deoxychorismate lyase [Gynuella sunshinyii YC6258]|uniref:Aminodeoxychorismate lyase n=2 Tax=Gynuella sunshinyii TaxID=1445505 RepID=A0A0C5VPL0_9GAMM|nr:branched-chain amino acid aminotransferase/4-amino-4-deoxychorismate lyase [Gynuella sunshinyii YC6258]
MAYGDGIFETIRVDSGRVAFLQTHLARLKESAVFFQLLPKDFNWAEFCRELDNVIEKIHDGVLKIILVRKYQGRGYRYTTDAGSEIIMECYGGKIPFGWQLDPADIGICSTPCSINSMLAGHKHLNRMDSVLASGEVQEKGWDDGLMCCQTQVIEATAANVFVVQKNSILTPEISVAGVNGVVRRILVSEPSLPVREVPQLTLSDCQNAQALFLTNAAKIVWPVNSLTVNGRIIRYDLTNPTLERVISDFRNRLSC